MIPAHYPPHPTLPHQLRGPSFSPPRLSFASDTAHLEISEMPLHIFRLLRHIHLHETTRLLHHSTLRTADVVHALGPGPPLARPPRPPGLCALNHWRPLQQFVLGKPLLAAAKIALRATRFQLPRIGSKRRHSCPLCKANSPDRPAPHTLLSAQ